LRKRFRLRQKEFAMTNGPLRALLMILAVLAVAGCASDPRYKEGLNWVVSQEQERQRLQAQGFPQYSFGE
jgi:hypothetical protein